MKKQTNKKGFTLLEILLVVAAISILAGIVIVAINPSKQLGDTRDAQRRSDVNTILNGVYQYSIDENGAMPSADITTTAKDICVTGGTCTGLVDLSALVPKYLVGIPKDPSSTDVNKTGYTILKTSDGRITVEASAPEQATEIKASK